MSDFTAAVSETAMPALASNREREQAALGVSERELNRPADRDPRMKRYTLVIEPAAYPEARREVIVEARDDGDAYDQAADHAAAELPYHCTIAIAKIEEIVEGPLHQPPSATPAETDADLLGSRLPGRLLPPRVNAMASLTRL
jgi:hypothetical protein